MNVRGWACALALLRPLGACSTLAPDPPDVECTRPSECDDGFVCELGVCLDAREGPPLAYIGLDVQERAGGQLSFRSEVAGCDEEVRGSSAQVQTLELPRAELVRNFSLALYDEPTSIQAAPRPLDATFTIRQPSRFNREPQQRNFSYAPNPDEAAPIIVVRWPRYHPDNSLPSALAASGYLTWEVAPMRAGATVSRAARTLLLTPAATLPDSECLVDRECCSAPDNCEPDDVRNACVVSQRACAAPNSVGYAYTYPDACDRQLRGRVVVVNDAALPIRALPGANVTLRYSDTAQGPRLTTPALDVTPIEERAPQCAASPGSCAQGLICNAQTDQCELPLAGRIAWSGTAQTAETGAAGSFAARVFTYCDDQPAPAGQPLPRAFLATVTPPPDTGLPSIQLNAEVAFDPQQGGQNPVAEFERDLCIPDFGAPQARTFAVEGSARQLIAGYTCCDVGCLPRDADDTAPPPSPPTRCSGASANAPLTAQLDAELRLSTAALQAWRAETSSCLDVRTEDDGTVGVARQSGRCTTSSTAPQSQCELTVLATSDDSAPTYRLRIESPVGSVTGSVNRTLSFAPLEDSQLPIDLSLPARTLVRGRVLLPDDLCASDEDCGSPGAQVLAERLTMAGETIENTVGPYFHQLATFYDPTAAQGQRAGSYILPLDPGVWVLTALPDSASPGGPARFTLLDLRDGPSSVEQDLVLEQGILVTVDVSSFDRRSQVVPLDTGSWLLPTQAQLIHPDRVTSAPPANLVDLGARGECLGLLTEGGQSTGCRIRRLIGGSGLPPSQLGEVRFTARKLDAIEAIDCR